ncbi:hypothetical protein EDC01DRAFT_672272 [Geopyxis carbonaria]|nr:hypothetical protein EDC01DRAFT_672272 [Geopyxis carbonaria]
MASLFPSGHQYSRVHPTSPATPTMAPSPRSDQTLKLAIRILKFASRLLSLACSTIVIGLSATSFHIFLTTRHLPARSGAPAWARPTHLWPQILLLVLAVISFAVSSLVLASYVRGHRRAERMSWLATAVSAASFVGAIVVWAAAGAGLQTWRRGQGGRDMWGWACDGGSKHARLFAGDVDYALVCRAQDWNFVCAMIHVAAESMAAAVWGAAA